MSELSDRLRHWADADVMETARDGTFEYRDGEMWAGIMREAADALDAQSELLARFWSPPMSNPSAAVSEAMMEAAVAAVITGPTYSLREQLRAALEAAFDLVPTVTENVTVALPSPAPGGSEPVAAYLTEEGALLVTKESGAQVKALMDALSGPPVGRKLLGLYTAQALALARAEGIKAAAQWHDAEAEKAAALMNSYGPDNDIDGMRHRMAGTQLSTHRLSAAAIRALQEGR